MKKNKQYLLLTIGLVSLATTLLLLLLPGKKKSNLQEDVEEKSENI